MEWMRRRGTVGVNLSNAERLSRQFFLEFDVPLFLYDDETSSSKWRVHESCECPDKLLTAEMISRAILESYEAPSRLIERVMSRISEYEGEFEGPNEPSLGN
jgi:hypothetical protein